MFDMMVSIIDMSVRELDQRTEVVARESYNAMPLLAPNEKPFRTLQEGFSQFAALGMRPHHWKEARAVFLLAMEKANPYLEEADAELLDMGRESCAYKFWSQRVMLPALRAIQDMDAVFESEENRQILQETLGPLLKDKKDSGVVFYKQLFHSHPEVLPFFGTTDMYFLAGHLLDAIELLVESFNDFGGAISTLNHLGRIHDSARIPTSAYSAIGEVLDQTFRLVDVPYADGSETGDKAVQIWSHLMNRACLVTSRVSFVSERLLVRSCWRGSVGSHCLLLICSARVTAQGIRVVGPSGL